jgi:hypothetical protein
MAAGPARDAAHGNHIKGGVTGCSAYGWWAVLHIAPAIGNGTLCRHNTPSALGTLAYRRERQDAQD